MLCQRYTSNNRHYWDAAIEAIDQIHHYINIINNDCDEDDLAKIALEAEDSLYPHPADYVRYVLFVEAVDRCRYIYETYCVRNRQGAFFGIQDREDTDQFFHEMLMDPGKLSAYGTVALNSYNRNKKAIPIRFLSEAA